MTDDNDNTDDLDAFFNEVEEEEIAVVGVKESSDNTAGDNLLTRTVNQNDDKTDPSNKRSRIHDDDNNAVDDDSEKDNNHYSSSFHVSKKTKIESSVVGPPIRPRGVVVASASVRPATTNTTAGSNYKESKEQNYNNVHAPSNFYEQQYQPQQQQHQQSYNYFGNSFLNPPPPPPPPPVSYPNVESGEATGICTAANNTHTSKKATGVVRTAAGKVWIDQSLADWPNDDFRLFVGNIDPTITDQQLFQHFSSKYNSVARSKIVRDPTKKVVMTMPTTTTVGGMTTTMSDGFGISDASNQMQQVQVGVSKGYGFVSLTNALDCAKALREMDQTWLGSRPIRVKRSHWKDRDYKEQQKRTQTKIKQRKKLGL